MSNELHVFVAEALRERIARKDIQHELERGGWPTEEIQAALDAYLDSPLPLPVPKRRPYVSAREAFLYLLMFLALYISSFSLGALVFDFINRWIPDPIAPFAFSDGSRAAIRQETASLIITFPIYALVSSSLWQALRRDPEKRQSKIRKWLTYLTLFVAASVIIGDLITLVANVLNGELGARFLLKTLTVFVIASGVFSYYLWDLHRDE